MINDNDQLHDKHKKTSKVLHGRWNKTEKQRFLKGLELHGRDWCRIQKLVKTRTLSQVRSHAQKVFLKLSENDIQTIYAQSPLYYPQNIGSSSQVKHQIKSKLQAAVPKKQVVKCKVKPEIDLLDIFMRAIEQEEREEAEQFEQGGLMDLQGLEKDEETKVKPDQLNRGQGKLQQVFSVKNNSKSNQSENQKLQNRPESNSVKTTYLLIQPLQ